MSSIFRALGRREDGIALPVVTGLGLVMLLLIASALSVATGGVRKTDTDEDWNAALAAAYAGVEEYQSRLANDATYPRYGNSASTFSTGSTVTMPSTDTASPSYNLAFGVGATGTWASIPTGDSAIPVKSYYRYEVDNRDYSTKGILHLRSTGRVGTTTRSIVADLKQDGFIDYLYFTNYETQDPAYTGGVDIDHDGDPDLDNGVSVCERHAWDSPARPGDCGEIQFGRYDTFAGPVRTNDRMVICGATFNGPVVSSSTTTPIWSKASGCIDPTFKISSPQYQTTIDMPPTNSELKRETRTDLPDDVSRPGCLYTGPTVIQYVVDSGVGKMRVWSPWTKFTQTTATTGLRNDTLCGTPGSTAGQLGSTGGALVPVLNLNLVFVQGVPAAGGGDPNAPTSAGYLPPNFTCTASGTYPNSGTSKNSKYPAGWALSTSTTSHGVTTTTYFQKFPMQGEVLPGGSSTIVDYGCRAGDVYVQGTVKGQTTLAAENYIYITNDLKYGDVSTDMLGLVGTNAIFVWNPMKGNSITSRSASSSHDALLGDDRTVNAAILSVGHTFQVQNYDRGGARGTLTVLGAIAQKFRGTVSTSSNGGSTTTNGYAKNYQYDTRYRYTAPPKFLTPVSTTYGVTQYATVPAAYDARGNQL